MRGLAGRVQYGAQAAHELKLTTLWGTGAAHGGFDPAGFCQPTL
jgi:hypothetical protein